MSKSSHKKLLLQGEGPTAPVTGTPAKQQQLPQSVAPAPHTHQFTANQQVSQQPPSLMSMQQGMVYTFIIRVIQFYYPFHSQGQLCRHACNVGLTLRLLMKSYGLIIKWNLFSSTFAWNHLVFSIILQNEIWDFSCIFMFGTLGSCVQC